MIGIQTQISLFARSVGDAARSAWRPSLLAPFALLGALELLLLFVYLDFAALGEPGERLVSSLFTSAAAHYPQHVWLLPSALAWIRLASALVIGVAAYPAATRRLLAFHSTTPVPPLAPGGQGIVLAAVLVYSVVDVVITLGVGHLADVRVIGRLQPLWVAMSLVLRPALTVALAHTVYGISVAGRRGFPALRSGLVVTQRRGVETLLLSGTAALLTAPLAVVLLLSGALVDAGTPVVAEFIAVLAVTIDIPVRRVIFGSVVWLRSPRGVLP